MNWLTDTRDIVVALLLVGLNGFFVAAEFALVKVRGSQLDVMGCQNEIAVQIVQGGGRIASTEN
jgi:CBS domain containing-hemolysin-like protein